MLIFLSHLSHRRNWKHTLSVLRSPPHSPCHTHTSWDLKGGYLQLWSSTRATKPERKCKVRPPPASISCPSFCSPSPHPPPATPPPHPRPPATPIRESRSRASSDQAPPPSLPISAFHPLPSPSHCPSHSAGRRPVPLCSGSRANPETCLSHPQTHPGCRRGVAVWLLPVPSASCSPQRRQDTSSDLELPLIPVPLHSPTPHTIPFMGTELCVNEGTTRLESGGGGALPPRRLRNPGEF